jgi:hypothetical protein
MKKIVTFLLLSVIAIGLLRGCNSTKLADSFDKTAVEASAKQAIEYLAAGDYNGIGAMMSDDVRKHLPNEVLAYACEKTCKNAGDLVEFGDMGIFGNKENKADYAVTIIEAKYGKKNVIFTITFDTGMKLAGIYMK